MAQINSLIMVVAIAIEMKRENLYMKCLDAMMLREISLLIFVKSARTKLQESMSLEFGQAIIDPLINMEVNVQTIGFNPKINKAVATLISGYRLFFWLKKSRTKNLYMYPDFRKIFTSHIYFKGLRGGVCVCPSFEKKKYI